MPHRFALPPLMRRPHSGAMETHSAFSELQREVDRLFEEFGRPFSERSTLSAWTPKLDVAETVNELTIAAELPGIDEQDVEVTLRDGVLTIKGEKKAETETKRKTYHLVERSYGSFERVIPLSFDVADDAVKAHFAKGVLTVRLPKPPEAKQPTRKIAIKTDL